MLKMIANVVTAPAVKAAEAGETTDKVWIGMPKAVKKDNK